MTTLYRPVLIETAEQAEALPIGTVAMSAATPGSYVHVKAGPDEWESTASTWSSTNLGMSGGDGAQMVALLPIEAKEETTRAEPFADGTIHVSPQYWRDEPSRRLATPWQPSPDRRGDCA